MASPIYKHPFFVTKTEELRIEKENKRLWLILEIDNNLQDTMVVILKNPSRATKDISDKTIHTVTKYIFLNKHKFPELKNVGKILILNLIPYYETYSKLLSSIDRKIIDGQNLEIISDFTSQFKNVIIAWGNHPIRLSKEYKQLTSRVLDVLKKNQNNIFYVDKLTTLGHPKHGQVWKYDDSLLIFHSN